MNPVGLIVAVTDWSESARMGVQRAACIGTQCGAQGLLVHVAPYRWAQCLHRVEKSDGAQSRISRLEQFAQSIYEKTGFSFRTQIHSGDIAKSIAQVWNVGDATLITLGQEADTWFGNGTARRLLRAASDPVLIVKREPEANYRRVLVAVDGSDRSIACIKQARMLAPDADMVVVSALDYALEDRLRSVDVPEEKIRDIRVQRHEEALDRLNAVLSDAGIPHQQVVKIVEHAHAPKLILDMERQFLIDLLVIGRSSASLLRRCFFRSVTSQVLAQARCDVLVVPTLQPANS